MTHSRKLKYLLVASILLAVLIASVPVLASATLFYVPKPNHRAIEQIADLTSSSDKADARLIKKMIETPQAVWFTKGTPKTVLQDVRNTVERAADKGTVPILVAYNIPFRDSAQRGGGHPPRSPSPCCRSCSDRAVRGAAPQRVPKAPRPPE